MATLTGKQLKDSYQSLVTIGDSITSDPTSGQLENGLGNPIDSVTIFNDATGVLDSSTLNLGVLSNDSNTNPRASIQAQKDGTNNGRLILNTSLSGTLTERLRIRSGGDISFRDGATNEAFYWDASTARLGIGTTLPATNLHISSSASTPALRIETTHPSGIPFLDLKGAASSQIRYIDETGTIQTRIDMLDSGGITFVDVAGGSERMRIDSSGNVGIGTTNIGNNSDYSALRLGATASLWAYKPTVNGNLFINENITAQDGNYIRSDFATSYRQGDGTHKWYNAPSGTAGASVSLVERMRIDSSGNVGIGETNPASKFHVVDTNKVIGSDGIVQIKSDAGQDYGGQITLGTTSARHAGIAGRQEGAGGSAGYLQFGTRASSGDIVERMRIDSSGNVNFNGIFASGSDRVAIGFASGQGYIQTSSSITTSIEHHYFYNPNGLIGSITTSGSSTSYNTTSDYRLKENVMPMEGALDRVAQLKPSRFNFIADAETTVDGFLAHEVAEIVPEAVTGEKDATEEYEVTPAVLDEDGNVIEEAVMGTRPIYQGIDQSKLVPLLVGAIQELRAEIEQLKAK